MPKVIQIGMNHKPAYVIELISEKFDKQSEEEKVKTLIHELMHIPHSFNGGFRQHHPYVTHAKVDQNYRKWVQKQREKLIQITTNVPTTSQTTFTGLV
jgi:predicted metallopeptidase